MLCLIPSAEQHYPPVFSILDVRSFPVELILCGYPASIPCKFNDVVKVLQDFREHALIFMLDLLFLGRRDLLEYSADKNPVNPNLEVV